MPPHILEFGLIYERMRTLSPMNQIFIPSRPDRNIEEIHPPEIMILNFTIISPNSLNGSDKISSTYITKEFAPRIGC